MGQLFDNGTARVRLVRKPSTWAVLVALVLGSTLAASLAAQGSAGARTRTDLAPAGSAKLAGAFRISSSQVSFDGALDDLVWQRATFISDFVQKEPTEGAVPSERTEVAFLFDDSMLYVGARMYANPD
ncbi:MAG: hypothetical protein V3R71_04575, partial [Gemmatimonadales bacterium]